MDIIKRVNELTKKLKVVVGNDGLSKEAQNNATLMFFCLLRCMLASRRVLEEHKLTDRSFNWLLGEVETRFNQVCAYLDVPCNQCAALQKAMQAKETSLPWAV